MFAVALVEKQNRLRRTFGNRDRTVVHVSGDGSLAETMGGSIDCIGGSRVIGSEKMFVAKSRHSGKQVFDCIVVNGVVFGVAVNPCYDGR